VYKGFFVDLYVRPSNQVATGMYEGMGYSVFRTVKDYYGNLGPGTEGGEAEDAYGTFNYKSIQCNLVYSTTRLINELPSTDMRKPLSRDPLRKSVRANGRDVIVSASSVS